VIDLKNCDQTLNAADVTEMKKGQLAMIAQK
jgi:hypothetical protein